MKITPDDPRLTAYALGELNETDHAAIKAELENSPECQRAVEEIQSAAAMLTEEFSGEELPDLTFAQQREIENKLSKPAEKAELFSWARLWFYGATACVVVIMAAMLLPSLSKSKEKARQVSLLNAEQRKATDNYSARLVSEQQIPPVVNQAIAKATPPLPGAVVHSEEAITPPMDQLKTGDALAFNNPITAAPAGSVTPTFQSGAGEAKALSGKLDSFNMTLTDPATATPLAVPALAGNGVSSQSSQLRPRTLQLSTRASQAPQQTTPYNLGDETQTQVPITGSLSLSSRGGGGGGGGGKFGSASGSDQLLTAGIPVNEAVRRQAGGVRGGQRAPIPTETPATDRYYSYDGPRKNEPAQQEEKSRALGFDLYLGQRLNSEQSQSGTATYPQLVENSFLFVAQNPLSTFSIDVDTASYANVRRFLTAGQLPPHDAVRIEEMINYFTYHYPQPKNGQPFSVNVEVAGCPWNGEHRLARVGLKGREIAQDKRPPSNFVFLIDVSGSMQPAERLPLIKQALRQLVKKMGEHDRVAIVVYANEAGLKLASTSCSEKEKILEAIDALGAGGSTNGGDGIQQAYRVASENFIEGGVNRVLLCTDGDFNVGLTDQNQLVKLIQDKAKSGVFLTTLGVGTDNYKDALMQKLADKGNGNYHYLDTLEEAQKVLIDQMSGTLVTIAKDVKIQIEFNPAQVGAYRLIGYEKRMLRKEDFNNDKKDAGEIGAGHTVTALYEIVPAGKAVNKPGVDPLKYQSEPQPEYVSTSGGGELMTVKLRYKQPDGDTSKLIEVPVNDSRASYSRASEDFKFAAAVASFGMVLRDSEYKGNANLSGVLELAQESKGRDEAGYRSEFIQLVKKARTLSGNTDR